MNESLKKWVVPSELTIENSRQEGGQQVGMTTGITLKYGDFITIEIDTERSQYKNKELALELLEYALSSSQQNFRQS